MESFHADTERAGNESPERPESNQNANLLLLQSQTDLHMSSPPQKNKPSTARIADLFFHTPPLQPASAPCIAAVDDGRAQGSDPRHGSSSGKRGRGGGRGLADNSPSRSGPRLRAAVGAGAGLDPALRPKVDEQGATHALNSPAATTFALTTRRT
jgi:hypothetical protein